MKKEVKKEEKQLRISKKRVFWTVFILLSAVFFGVVGGIVHQKNDGNFSFQELDRMAQDVLKK